MIKPKPPPVGSVWQTWSSVRLKVLSVFRYSKWTWVVWNHTAKKYAHDMPLVELLDDWLRWARTASRIDKPKRSASPVTRKRRCAARKRD